MSTTTNYIWDDQNYLAESDATNTINVVYTNEPQRYGNLISSRISGAASYHEFDGLGSTRQLTNLAAAITDTMTHDAWGNAVARTGSTAVVFRWVGELGYYFDVETASHSVRARTYGGVVSRWTTVDPSGFPDGINRYDYVRNSPVVATDPSGLATWWCCGLTSEGANTSGSPDNVTYVKYEAATVAPTAPKTHPPYDENDGWSVCQYVRNSKNPNYRVVSAVRMVHGGQPCPDGPGACHYKVCSVPIAQQLFGKIGDHLHVVLPWAVLHPDLTFRAGPGGAGGGDCPQPAPGGMGYLVAHWGFYAPGNIDWVPRDERVCATFSAPMSCANLQSCFTSVLNALNRKCCVPYDPLILAGANSNTFVYYLLNLCLFGNQPSAAELLRLLQEEAQALRACLKITFTN